jgi:hypothetical protein
VIVDGMQRARVGAKVAPKMADASACYSSSRRKAMNLGSLSVNQPILAMVLSIVLLIVGALAYTTLPVSEYPQVAPPTVVVTTQYPGASAQTVSETVATPIEQEINGVEDMLYLYSQATSNGQLNITVTFKLGTDLDKAQVLVQNRVAIAQPRLPEEVQRNGVTTRKNSPDLMMVVFMLSPDDTLRPALHLQLRAASRSATSCCVSTASATSRSLARATIRCGCGSIPTRSPISA